MPTTSGTPSPRREPPAWVPRAAFWCIPSTLVATGLLGAVHVALGVIALAVGLWATAALIGWWMVESDQGGYIAMIRTSLALAIGLTAFTVAISWAAVSIDLDGAEARDGTSDTVPATTVSSTTIAPTTTTKVGSGPATT